MKEVLPDKASSEDLFQLKSFPLAYTVNLTNFRRSQNQIMWSLTSMKFWKLRIKTRGGYSSWWTENYKI